MNVPSVNDLKKIGRGERFFQWAFGLNGDGKTVFIGREGAGESALLSTAAGVLVPDEGPAVINKNSGILFLPRNPSFSESGEIRGHVFKGGPDYRGFRCGNRERLALVVGITLPRPGDSPAVAAGLNAGCGKSTGIADISTVFPAWRMDDKRRIYALLAEADWEKICGLTERCFELVNGKK